MALDLTFFNSENSTTATASQSHASSMSFSDKIGNCPTLFGSVLGEKQQVKNVISIIGAEINQRSARLAK